MARRKKYEEYSQEALDMAIRHAKSALEAMAVKAAAGWTQEDIINDLYQNYSTQCGLTAVLVFTHYSQLNKELEAGEDLLAPGEVKF